MAQVALPGDHDRADLRHRTDRVALSPRVLVPPAGVTAPRDVAPGGDVVGAPADWEPSPRIRTEAARLDDGRHRAARS